MDRKTSNENSTTTDTTDTTDTTTITIQEKLNGMIAKLDEIEQNNGKLRAENIDLIQKNVALNHELRMRNHGIEAYQTNVKRVTNDFSIKFNDLVKFYNKDLLPTLKMPPIGPGEMNMAARTANRSTLLVSTTTNESTSTKRTSPIVDVAFTPTRMLQMRDKRNNNVQLIEHGEFSSQQAAVIDELRSIQSKQAAKEILDKMTKRGAVRLAKHIMELVVENEVNDADMNQTLIGPMTSSITSALASHDDETVSSQNGSNAIVATANEDAAVTPTAVSPPPTPASLSPTPASPSSAATTTPSSSPRQSLLNNSNQLNTNNDMAADETSTSSSNDIVQNIMVKSDDTNDGTTSSVVTEASFATPTIRRSERNKRSAENMELIDLNSRFTRSMARALDRSNDYGSDHDATARKRVHFNLTPLDMVENAKRAKLQSPALRPRKIYKRRITMTY